ncbi:hypothetical protein L7F22_066545 [Adiantum nelumboides]|nr:hypothetical protein [Adiantum nelumboides]
MRRASASASCATSRSCASWPGWCTPVPQAERLRPREVVEILARSVMMEMDFRLEAAAASELAENTKDDLDFPRAEARMGADRPRGAVGRVDRGHPPAQRGGDRRPGARPADHRADRHPELPAPRDPRRLLPRRHAPGEPAGGRRGPPGGGGFRHHGPPRPERAPLPRRDPARLHPARLSPGGAGAFRGGLRAGPPLGGGFRAGDPGDRRADPPAPGRRDLDGQGADPAVRRHRPVRHEHPHRAGDAPEDHGGGGGRRPLPRPAARHVDHGRAGRARLDRRNMGPVGRAQSGLEALRVVSDVVGDIPDLAMRLKRVLVRLDEAGTGDARPGALRPQRTLSGDLVDAGSLGDCRRGADAGVPRGVNPHRGSARRGAAIPGQVRRDRSIPWRAPVGLTGQSAPILGRDVLGGEHDHRHVAAVRARPERPQEGEAVHLGHHQIQQDQARPFRFEGREGAQAVLGLAHREALALEIGADMAPNVRLVVDDEDRPATGRRPEAVDDLAQTSPVDRLLQVVGGAEREGEVLLVEDRHHHDRLSRRSRDRRAWPRSTAQPSICGMVTSRSTARGCRLRARSSPRRPSSATVTEKPSRSRKRASRSRVAASSSITKMVPRSPGPAALSASASSAAPVSKRTGRVSVKVVPSPCRLSTAIAPPSISAKARVIARPSPVPPKRRVVEASAWVKRSKQPPHLLRCHPDPGIGHGEAHRRVDPGDREGDPAVLGELRGVAQEIDQALAQLGDVGVGAAQIRLQRQRQGVALLGDQTFDRDGDLLDHGGDVEILGVDLDPVGLDLGNVEHVVDQAEEVPGVGLDLLHVGDQVGLADILQLLLHHLGIAITAESGVRNSWLILARNWLLAALAASAAARAASMAASASLRSVMSVWVPTHSRRVPSDSRIGTARTLMCRYAPEAARIGAPSRRAPGCSGRGTTRPGPPGVGAGCPPGWRSRRWPRWPRSANGTAPRCGADGPRPNGGWSRRPRRGRRPPRSHRSRRSPRPGAGRSSSRSGGHRRERREPARPPGRSARPGRPSGPRRASVRVLPGGSEAWPRSARRDRPRSRVRSSWRAPGSCADLQVAVEEAEAHRRVGEHAVEQAGHAQGFLPAHQSEAGEQHDRAQRRRPREQEQQEPAPTLDRLKGGETLQRRGLTGRRLGADRVHQLLAFAGADQLDGRLEPLIAPRRHDPGREVPLLRDQAGERGAAGADRILRGRAEAGEFRLNLGEGARVGGEVILAADQDEAPLARLQVLHLGDQALDPGDGVVRVGRRSPVASPSLEGGVEGGARLGVGGNVVDGRAAELLQPEVGTGVEPDDVHALLQGRDEGQEQRPVQAALVEPVGLDVRGRHHRDAPPEQGIEQATQEHRVGDVGDGELVEAQQCRLVGELVGHRPNRVVALDGAGLERLPVHQHGLAAPDRAPDVEAPDRFGFVLAPEQPAEGARLAGALATLQVQDQAVEGAHQMPLGRIALDRPGGDQGLVSARGPAQARPRWPAPPATGRCACRICRSRRRFLAAGRGTGSAPPAPASAVNDPGPVPVPRKLGLNQPRG